MKKHLRDFFIPHAENNYHPHILHTKRAAFYGGIFLFTKIIIFVAILLIPNTVFVLPDILKIERAKIVALTNQVRAEKKMPLLREVDPLLTSSDLKAKDMADNQYFDHVGPKNRNLSYFLERAAYPYDVAGENLAMGFSLANEVVSAWKDSPTHYANILDADYEEIGVSIETGFYNDIPTVYVAEHFGRQREPDVIVAPKEDVRRLSLDVKKTDLEINGTMPEKSDGADDLSQVLSETLVSEPIDEQIGETSLEENAGAGYADANAPIIGNPEALVGWENIGKGTKLNISAAIYGKITQAAVIVGKYFIPLRLVSDGVWEGELMTADSPRSFFSPITSPSLQVIDIYGGVHLFPAKWKSVFVAGPTPIEKYIHARQALPFLTSLFDVSRTVYLAAAVFFIIALMLNIFIEIRRQHHHIIVQTLALIFLLFTLAAA